MTLSATLRPRDTNLQRCPECGVSVERDKIDLPHRCHPHCPLTEGNQFLIGALLRDRRETTTEGD